MASNSPRQNSYNHNFRPQSGYNSGISYWKQNRGSSNCVSISQSRESDDETTAYAVNLLLKPVEMGIKAKNNGFYQEFKGLGAFNHYFGLLAPTKGLGYTLPDIWDGYFHITLAKFSTRLTYYQLKEAFNKFQPSLEGLPDISNTIFRASTIRTISGKNRSGRRKNIHFVVLPIDLTDMTKALYEKLQPLIEEIRQQTEPTDWNPTLLRDLHVTVRKYSNINFHLDKIKIQSFPLEFQCSHLEIRQPREQATNRYKKEGNNTDQWWTGVTEQDEKCSGCSARIMSDEWEGFCLVCGKYESIIPIWSTDGKNAYHYYQIQQEEFTQNNYNNNTLSRQIQHVNLND